VSDLPETCKVPHGVHHVMRRFSFWLVDDQRAVKRRLLWLAWHAMSFQS
jgi:hypothetical protein